MEIVLPPMIKHWDEIPYYKKHGPNPVGKSPFRERNAAIVYMRLRGESLPAIGRAFKISHQRVRQIYEASITAFWAAMDRENAKFESQLTYYIGSSQ